MSTAIDTSKVTFDQFLQRETEVDDNVYLELINGEVKEYQVTTRSPAHSNAIGRISQALNNWLDDSNRPGSVGAGEVRCRLFSEHGSLVGIDVAYFEDVEIMVPESGGSYYDGPPIIAVEVLSPSDSHEAVSDRIKVFLKAGVKQVWIADPDFQTITVYRNDVQPVLFSKLEDLPGGPELTGFCRRVELLFQRKRSDS